MAGEAGAVVNAGPSGATVIPGAASAGGPTGAQGGAGTPAPAVTTGAGAVTADWTSSLAEQQKLYVTQKGFKDPSAVLESYKNLESLMGAPRERLLKLPDAPDAPEWADIYDKLGRPKNANEYQFAKPNVEGFKENTEFTDWAQKQFHELGLTKAQGEKLAAKWNEYAMGDVTKQNLAREAAVKTEDISLHKEWGAAYDQKIKGCQAAAQAFGLGKEHVAKLEQALGYSATLKFLSDIGSKLSEDSFVGTATGEGFKGALTPDQAQAQINDLKGDKDWVRRYSTGGAPEKQQLERLMRFAYPDLPND